jgi:protein SCO1/2
MSKHRTTAIGVLAALALVAVACSDDEPSAAATTPPTPEPEATAETAVAPLATTPRTSLIDSPASTPIEDPQLAPELVDLVQPDGSTFDLASLRGENVLLFFGYTHCPDVCPQTLTELFGVIEEEPQIQAVFVSVDPERDTPEFLSEWTSYMPENLHAVTGSPGAIRRAADDYGVKYARVETTSTAGYTMSHTADLYLIDEDGLHLATYPFGTTSAEIVEDLQQLKAS